MRILLGILGLVLFLVEDGVGAAAAASGDAASVCRRAAARVEAEHGLPRHLLWAISRTESGRWDKARGRSFAWPWTVTSGSDSFRLETKDDAVATVERLRRAGRRNIDVGCMQINLMYHPDAFSDLGEALDPMNNARYAASLLERHRAEARTWARAVAWYHSRTPERGNAYRGKVYDHWNRVKREARKEARGGRGAAPALVRADAETASGGASTAAIPLEETGLGLRLIRPGAGDAGRRAPGAIIRF